jgi:hypothetical protein
MMQGGGRLDLDDEAFRTPHGRELWFENFDGDLAGLALAWRTVRSGRCKLTVGRSTHAVSKAPAS